MVFTQTSEKEFFGILTCVSYIHFSFNCKQENYIKTDIKPYIKAEKNPQIDTTSLEVKRLFEGAVTFLINKNCMIQVQRNFLSFVSLIYFWMNEDISTIYTKVCTDNPFAFAL